MPITAYASWLNVAGSLTARDTLVAYADWAVSDFDMDGVESDYRTAVVALLPGSMALVGEEFIAEVGDEEIPGDWRETLAEEIERIDLEPIFEAHPAIVRHTYTARWAPYLDPAYQNEEHTEGWVLEDATGAWVLDLGLHIDAGEYDEVVSAVRAAVGTSARIVPVGPTVRGQTNPVGLGTSSLDWQVWT